MGKRRWPEGQRGLTDRQQRFVEEYMVDLNCNRAARRAGYSPNIVSSQAMLMGTPHVRAAIEAQLALRADLTRLDAERVIAELGKLAFSNMLDYLAIDEHGAPRIDLTALSREHGSAIQSITVDYYRAPRPRKSRAKTPAPRAAAPIEPAPGDGDPQASAAMGSVRRVRITLADKRSALVELARHLGMRAPNGASDIPAVIHVITGVPRAGDPPYDPALIEG